MKKCETEDKKNCRVYGNKFLREILANPVGRMLLYRIAVLLSTNKNNKDKQKKIIVKFEDGTKKATVSGSDCDAKKTSNEIIIRIVINKPIMLQTISGTSTKFGKTNLRMIGVMDTPIDIIFFHELLHCYHFLQDPYRYFEEVADDKYQVDLLAYFFKILDDNNGFVFKWLWKQISTDFMNQNIYVVSVEEFRNKVGFYQALDKNYQNGDELSENLYRYFRGTTPLSFGHENFCYYIADTVIGQIELQLKKIAEKIDPAYRKYYDYSTIKMTFDLSEEKWKMSNKDCFDQIHEVRQSLEEDSKEVEKIEASSKLQGRSYFDFSYVDKQENNIKREKILYTHFKLGDRLYNMDLFVEYFKEKEANSGIRYYDDAIIPFREKKRFIKEVCNASSMVIANCYFCKKK